MPGYPGAGAGYPGAPGGGMGYPGAAAYPGASGAMGYPGAAGGAMGYPGAPGGAGTGTGIVPTTKRYHVDLKVRTAIAPPEEKAPGAAEDAAAK